MSSNNGAWRRFIEYLDRNPLVDSILEMVIILATTFVPFLIAAGWPLLYETPLSSEKLSSSFLGFFSRGELSISLLGLCGTIIWIFFIRASVTSKLGKFAVGTIMVTILVIGLGIIAGNPGFTKNPPEQTHFLLTFAYIVALILWFITLITLKSPQAPPIASEDANAERTKDLLRRAGRAES